jgi:hypothetical protein
VFKRKSGGFFISTVIAAACTSLDHGPKPQEEPFVQIMAVSVREVSFNHPIDGKSEGLEFALARSGGGFPVLANSNPVLVVGEVVVAPYSFTPEGISFFSSHREALKPGSRITIRWGEGPTAPNVDTGASYEPDAVKPRIQSMRPRVP